MLAEDFPLTRGAAFLLAAIFSCSVATVPLSAQTAEEKPAPKPLSVEAIFAHGPLIGTPPDGLTWSPDGKHLTYIDGGELVDLDPATAKSHVLVSRAKLAALSGSAGTETDRDHRERYKMASYLWAPDSAHLLFDANGRLWLYDLKTGTGVEVGFTGLASGDDPKFSPNGDMVSFVRDHGLSVLRLKESGSPALMVATPPNQTTTNGEVDWVYEEELDVRSNYFWSPDSAHLAYLQMNETAVPEYPITGLDSNPRAGEYAALSAAGRSESGCARRRGGRGRRQDGVGAAAASRAARTTFRASDGSIGKHALGGNRDARPQAPRLSTSPTRKPGRRTRCSRSPTISLSTKTTMCRWAKEPSCSPTGRDGHNQLYLYSYDEQKTVDGLAKLERQLTKGNFDVGDVLSVEHRNKLVRLCIERGQSAGAAAVAGELRRRTQTADPRRGNA